MKDLGFAHAAFTTADVYERGRSGYPDEAVACLVSELGIGAGSTVVDLAAGTGKLTRLLVPTGARVVAVEPVADMRRQLAQVVSEARPVAATAEHLPIAGGTVDALTVAQAFHWFDPDRALAEIHRVLRPGGRLGIVGNRADTSVAWVARLSSIRGAARTSGGRPMADARSLLRSVARKVAGLKASVLGAADPSGPGGGPGEGEGVEGKEPSWVTKSRAAFETTTLFTPLEERVFRHGEEMDADRLVDWVASFSPFSRLSPAEQGRTLGQVRELAAELPPKFQFPYRTDVFWCTAK